MSRGTESASQVVSYLRGIRGIVIFADVVGLFVPKLLFGVFANQLNCLRALLDIFHKLFVFLLQVQIAHFQGVVVIYQIVVFGLEIGTGVLRVFQTIHGVSEHLLLLFETDLEVLGLLQRLLEFLVFIFEPAVALLDLLAQLLDLPFFLAFCSNIEMLFLCSSTIDSNLATLSSS